MKMMVDWNLDKMANKKEEKNNRINKNKTN